MNKNQHRGKPPSIKSDQADVRQLLLFTSALLADKLELDPEVKSELLSKRAIVARDASDTGWVKSDGS